MKLAALILLLGIVKECLPQTVPSIISQEAEALVYLQVEDATGGILNTGTGFIVSPDGYIITVAHLKAIAPQSLKGAIGDRHGQLLSLSFVGSDESHDLALWRLPTLNHPYHTISLTDMPVSTLDSGVVLGFPMQENLSASRVSIRNVNSLRGFYKSDGYLQHGNSGGPMLNIGGDAVALVQGGTLPGTEDNDLIPIIFAIDLLKKSHVAGATVHSPSSSTCAIPPSPLPPPNADYESMFSAHQNEADLSKLGLQAFAKKDYLWAIKFFEQAQALQGSKVWEANFPYLAAARLLANKDHKTFQCTLQQMLAAMREPGYLHHSGPIGFALNSLSDVRGYVDREAQRYIDDVVVPEAIDIKQRLV